MGLKFYKVGSAEPAAGYLFRRINQRLKAAQPVVWLLSGGSAIEVAVLAAKRLYPGNPKLAVSLVDERYGPVGHPDSNWQQLLTQGFELPEAALQPVLTGDSVMITAQKYERLMERLLTGPAYKIGLLGMGADGHAAGILPLSPAVRAGSLISSYRGPNYQRLTLTATGLERLDETVVYAAGEAKRQALNNLNKGLSLDEQPAQILKRLPKVLIFNDIRGEDYAHSD